MILELKYEVKINVNGVKYNVGLGVTVEHDVSDNQIETAIDQHSRAIKQQIKKLVFPKRSDMENSR